MLISEERTLSNFKQHVKVYYEHLQTQLKEEYVTSGFTNENFYGSYKSYYENGKIEVEGQFHEGEFTNLRTGIWKWYKKDGSIDLEETYKADVVFWPNGKMKVAGSYIFDKAKNGWLMTREWKWFDEKGTLIDKKEYNLGKENDKINIPNK